MRLYFSGWQATNKKRESVVVKADAIRHRCFSFAMIQKLPGLPYYLPKLQGAYDVCRKHKVGIMMDSGVVSWRSYRATLRKAGKDTSKLPDETTFIQLYVDYVKAHKDEWDMYFTIDLERNAEDIFRRHYAIEEMGITPVPVFHGDSSLDILRKYRDKGCTLMGLASWRTIRTQQTQFRAYFDGCFNLGEKIGMKFHGLAMTAPWLMLTYPWFSVDSSSWSRVAGYGSIMYFDEHKSRMSTFHISDRHSEGKSGAAKENGRMMDCVKEMVTNEGFDFGELQTDFVQRHVWNGKQMLKLVDTAEKRTQSGWLPLF
jgi:hypothetical protein